MKIPTGRSSSTSHTVKTLPTTTIPRAISGSRESSARSLDVPHPKGNLLLFPDMECRSLDRKRLPKLEQASRNTLEHQNLVNLFVATGALEFVTKELIVQLMMTRREALSSWS